MSYSSLTYKIALSLIPGVGNILAKKLVAYAGSLEGVFYEKKHSLVKIPGVGKTLAGNIANPALLDLAALEEEYTIKNGIRVFFYLDSNYPSRLKDCPDAPVLFFMKGEADLNQSKVLSMVGTRRATHEGKAFCEKLIAQLREKNHEVLIVSGLAFGIDITSHRAALNSGFPTVAVLAHGFEFMYPASHARTAREIVAHGGLITEFLSYEKPEPPYFVKRNRIIAGLSDATIVIESDEKGGALITAEIAAGYHRDVFAVPGRVTDNMSRGCNRLIKTNQAALLEKVEDIEYLMGWDENLASRPVQTSLFADLNEEEKNLAELLRDQSLTIDEISRAAGMPVSKASSLLLNLEFSGLVRCLPGKLYRLNR
ncbi:MAG: DNA-processing protein DprA [Bacteroidales bacterium]